MPKKKKTAEEKAASRFEKQLKFAKTKKMDTYLQKFVAKDLQAIVRAEAGLFVGMVKCVKDHEPIMAESAFGRVRCVTCAKDMPWSASGTHAGHFLGGRGAGIVLVKDGIHPQCYVCNERLSGNGRDYQTYMLYRYDQAMIDGLTLMRNGYKATLGPDGKREELDPYSWEDLVKLRLGYMDELRGLVKRLEDNDGGVTWIKV